MHDAFKSVRNNLELLIRRHIFEKIYLNFEITRYWDGVVRSAEVEEVADHDARLVSDV